MSAITSAAEIQAQAALRTQSRQHDSTYTSASGAGFFDILSDVYSQSYANSQVSMNAIFEEAAARYQLPVDLLKAVAKVESNFDPYAVSGSGAMGVMQLMPSTAKNLGVTNPYDARQNIMGGAAYLRENLDRFGSVDLALAAYNAGPGAVQQYGGIPPYEKVQNYVTKVMSYLDEDTLSAENMFSAENILNAGNAAVSGWSLAGSQDSALVELCKYITSMGGYGSLLGYTALTGFDGLGSYGSLYSSLGSLTDYSSLYSMGDYGSLYSSLYSMGDYSSLSSLSSLNAYSSLLGSMNEDNSAGSLSSLLGYGSLSDYSSLSALGGYDSVYGSMSGYSSLFDLLGGLSGLGGDGGISSLLGYAAMSDYISRAEQLNLSEDEDADTVEADSYSDPVQELRVQMMSAGSGARKF